MGAQSTESVPSTSKKRFKMGNLQKLEVKSIVPFEEIKGFNNQKIFSGNSTSTIAQNSDKYKSNRGFEEAVNWTYVRYS